jgi:hypothetical protein
MTAHGILLTEIESLQKKNDSMKEKISHERLITHLIYIAIIAIFILFFCNKCVNKNNLISSLTNKADSLQTLLNDCRNQKAVPNVNDTLINGKSGKYITAKIVALTSLEESSMFIEDVIKRVPFKVLVYSKCPTCPITECPKLKVDSCVEKVCLDTLTNDSIEVCLDKQYRADSSRILMLRKLALRDFILNNPSANINFTHTYIEYLENPYRVKAEQAFTRAIISGIFSIGLYATSESLGHPKYWDNRDNSGAQKKHDEIFLLRAGSTVFGLYSAFEFGRTIYFHKQEAKFIFNPTKISLTIYLDKK